MNQFFIKLNCKILSKPRNKTLLSHHLQYYFSKSDIKDLNLNKFLLFHNFLYIYFYLKRRLFRKVFNLCYIKIDFYSLK